MRPALWRKVKHNHGEAFLLVPLDQARIVTINKGQVMNEYQLLTQSRLVIYIAFFIMCSDRNLSCTVFTF
jgi:hypothetical protein